MSAEEPFTRGFLIIAVFIVVALVVIDLATETKSPAGANVEPVSSSSGQVFHVVASSPCASSFNDAVLLSRATARGDKEAVAALTGKAEMLSRNTEVFAGGEPIDGINTVVVRSGAAKLARDAGLHQWL